MLIGKGTTALADDATALVDEDGLGVGGALVDGKDDLSKVRNEVETAGYGLVNLRASYSWKQVRIDFGIENLFDHLERVLIGSGFLNPDNPRHLMLRLRRLCARAEPDSNEVAILRGILSALVPGSGRPSPRQNEDIGAE